MSAVLEYRDYIGATYKGSIEEAHGAVVVGMWVCGCCYYSGIGVSPRVSATVRQDGKLFRMNHARPTSFELPENRKPPVVLNLVPRA